MSIFLFEKINGIPIKREASEWKTRNDRRIVTDWRRLRKQKWSTMWDPGLDPEKTLGEKDEWNQKTTTTTTKTHNSLAPRCAWGPGSGAEKPLSWDLGRGCPLTHHAGHVRGEDGAKAFVDDLLLGQGFQRSRAAPRLWSIESQPSTQGFVNNKKM